VAAGPGGRERGRERNAAQALLVRASRSHDRESTHREKERESERERVRQRERDCLERYSIARGPGQVQGMSLRQQGQVLVCSSVRNRYAARYVLYRMCSL
jgi:hypothetical protein